MSGIALYNVLTKLGAASDEAEKAVADVASSKEVTTKADLNAGLAELETRLTKLIYAVVAINTGVIIAAVGLMIKFL